MSRIGASGSLSAMQLDTSTCCYDVGNPSNRFPNGFTFDRIIASNVGPVAKSQVLFDPIPNWAKSDGMHRPVIGHFTRSASLIDESNGASLRNESKMIQRHRRGSLRAAALKADTDGEADGSSMLQLEDWEEGNDE